MAHPHFSPVLANKNEVSRPLGILLICFFFSRDHWKISFEFNICLKTCKKVKYMELKWQTHLIMESQSLSKKYFQTSQLHLSFLIWSSILHFQHYLFTCSFFFVIFFCNWTISWLMSSKNAIQVNDFLPLTCPLCLNWIKFMRPIAFIASVSYLIFLFVLTYKTIRKDTHIF